MSDDTQKSVGGRAGGVNCEEGEVRFVEMSKLIMPEIVVEESVAEITSH